MAGEGEKTEQPTSRRLSEARKKGQIAKSMDMNTAVVLAAGVFVLRAQFGHMGEQMSKLARDYLGAFPRQDLTPDALRPIAFDLMMRFVTIAAPTILLILAAGLLVNYLQVGVLFTTETLKFDLQKINPISGLKRLGSRRSLMEALKGVLKMTIVGWVVYQVLASRYPKLANLTLMERADVAGLVGGTAWEIAWKAVVLLFVFGVADLLYQRFEHTRSLRMTKQEVKDEAKQSEGDPQVKGRIKRLQREAARRRMMSSVPKATVVITNPTHFAVALAYDRENDPAPRCVAKGMDAVALRIREVATEAGVPIVENPPLARSLYKLVNLEQEIPEDLYAAVAEILVAVQKLNRKRKTWSIPGAARN